MRESPATVLQAPEKVMKAVSASASRYAMIHQVLRDAIVNGTARHGLVLLEAPLAELFGTSRVPVRKALDLLHAEGLICRFNGRGYLINPEGLVMEPLRLPLSHAHLGLNGEAEPVKIFVPTNRITLNFNVLLSAQAVALKPLRASTAANEMLCRSLLFLFNIETSRLFIYKGINPNASHSTAIPGRARTPPRCSSQ